MDSGFVSRYCGSHASGGHTVVRFGAYGTGLDLSAETVRRALSWAVREIFPSIVVDMFWMRLASARFVAIAMRFRSPMCYSEVGDRRDLSLNAAAASDTAMLIESQVGLALIDLFGFVYLDEVSVCLNAFDQVVCTIAARAPARVTRPTDDEQPDAAGLGGDEDMWP